jgi:hypothetical protein
VGPGKDLPCLWVLQPLEITQNGNQLTINCVFPDVLFTIKISDMQIFVSLNPAAQTLSNEPPLTLICAAVAEL